MTRSHQRKKRNIRGGGGKNFKGNSTGKNFLPEEKNKVQFLHREITISGRKSVGKSRVEERRQILDDSPRANSGQLRSKK